MSTWLRIVDIVPPCERKVRGCSIIDGIFAVKQSRDKQQMLHRNAFERSEYACLLQIIMLLMLKHSRLRDHDCALVW